MGLNVATERVSQAKETLLGQMGMAYRKTKMLQNAMPQIKDDDERIITENAEKAKQLRQIRKSEAISRTQKDFQNKLIQYEHNLSENGNVLSHITIPIDTEDEQISVCMTPMLSECVSLGNIVLESGTYPALVPFSSQRGLYMYGEERIASQIALQIAGQLISTLPERNLAIHVFDPTLTATFGILSPLRQLRGGLFPVPEGQSTVFNKVLEEILSKASTCAEKIVAAGEGSLKDLWDTNPIADNELQLVIVLDYPFAVDATMHGLLMRLSALGAASGIQLVICEKSGVGPSRDVLPEDLRRMHTCIKAGRDKIEILGWDSEEISIIPNASFDAQQISKIISARIECSKNAVLPTIPLEDIITFGPDSLWRQSSIESLEAIFGRIGRDEPMRVAFRSENPPTANMLVGGAVGQGKSNLLLDIIYALSCSYSPSEMELYLLDFKQGVEFKRFDADANGENYLPHARVLGIETNQVFGVSVLRFLTEELERRSSMFKTIELKNGQRGVSSINQYRKETGGTLPRILLIIDEFHRIFDGDRDRAENAVDLLEVLARQGRSFGIHMILATQTISGITAMGTRKDAIFAQFPLRMSLKNTVQESQSILSNGNKAAAELSFRGEVVLNENTGMDPENCNRRGLAAFADPEKLPALQTELWKKGHSRPPLMFSGSAFAKFPAEQYTRYSQIPQGEKGPSFWLGQRIAVSDEPFAVRLFNDADQGIALVGIDDETMPMMPGLFHSMMMSAALWLQANRGEVLVLSGEGDTPSAWMEAGLTILEKLSIPMSFIGKGDVKNHLLNNLRTRIGETGRPPLLVVAPGIQKIQGLEEEFKDGDGIGAPRFSGRTVLQDLASKGAVNDVFFIGGWNNLQAVQTDMGMKRSALFCYITIKLGMDDLKNLVSARVSRIEGHPRLGVYERTNSAGLIEVVPYETPGGNL